VITEGDIVLFEFPQTDKSSGKLRPALVLRKCPGQYDDWLICMISSQLRQANTDLDVTIRYNDPEFETSGLKIESVIRASRLAVISADVLKGSIGKLSATRIKTIQQSIANWIADQ